MRKPGPRHLVVVLDLELGATRPARVLSASETAAERSVNPSAPPLRCAASLQTFSLFPEQWGWTLTSSPFEASQKVKITKANLVHEISVRCLSFLLVFRLFI